MTALRRILLTALLGAVLTACTTTRPPSHEAFEAWDADGDGIIDRGEFFNGFARARYDAAWDTDRDRNVAADEFAAAAFRTWDGDGDRALDEVEWRASVLEWDEPGIDFGPFPIWDADRSGRIDPEEFAARLARTGLYAVWDRDLDRTLTPTELAEGFYRLWDRNKSGYLDGHEWAHSLAVRR